MIKEKWRIWAVPSISFIVFIYFDFEVDLHENYNNSILQVIKPKHLLTRPSSFLFFFEQDGLERVCVLLLIFVVTAILYCSRCMATLVNLTCSPLSLSSIKTVTQVLPLCDHQIIVVGHSPDSLKRLQILYQIHDTSSGLCISNGTISKFAVIFLTPYVASDIPGHFLALVSSMGCRKVLREGFGQGETRTVIREVQLGKLQEQARSESFMVYYSPIYKRVYVLVQLTFGEQEQQLVLRGYEEEREVVSYRIVTLEQPQPQVVCSPTRIIFACGSEIALYQKRLEPRYFVLSNMEQFDILGFYSEFILRLKEDGSIFTMSLGGTLRPLLEGPVVDYSLGHDRLYFLMGGSSSVIKVFKVKDAQLNQETQMQAPNATKILSASTQQIIVGPL